MAPRVANWLPWYPFLALGPIQGHKVQHLLVAWGRLNFNFSPYFSLDSYCKALGAKFNFWTNRNALLGLNIGPDSQCKAGLTLQEFLKSGRDLTLVLSLKSVLLMKSRYKPSSCMSSDLHMFRFIITFA